MKKTKNAPVGAIMLVVAIIFLVGVSIYVGDKKPDLASDDMSGSADVQAGGGASGAGNAVGSDVSGTGGALQGQSKPSSAASPASGQAYQKYIESGFGFTFSYPTAWKLGARSGGSDLVPLALTQPDGDWIAIVEVSGSQAEDKDAKFGDVIYYFNGGANSWMTFGDNDIRGGAATNAPTKAVPIFYTDSGLPVFAGTGRWKTDIVALSHSKFLIVNITGSGATASLDPFVKTIALTPSAAATASGQASSAVPARNPTISDVQSARGYKNQFYAGEQVTLSGTDFPVSSRASLVVRIGPAKIADAAIVSATSDKIVFTAPSVSGLLPGSYQLFVTGAVPATPAGTGSSGASSLVQSNIVPVTALPSLVINALSASTVRVGDTVSIWGKGFMLGGSAGVELEIRTTAVQGGSASSGLIWTGQAQSDTSIVFVMPSSYCSFGGAPGVPCTEKSALVPGDYILQIMLPNGGSSNEVSLTVR